MKASEGPRWWPDGGELRCPGTEAVPGNIKEKPQHGLPPSSTTHGHHSGQRGQAELFQARGNKKTKLKLLTSKSCILGELTFPSPVFSPLLLLILLDLIGGRESGKKKAEGLLTLSAFSSRQKVLGLRSPGCGWLRGLCRDRGQVHFHY